MMTAFEKESLKTLLYMLQNEIEMENLDLSSRMPTEDKVQMVIACNDLRWVVCKLK